MTKKGKSQKEINFKKLTRNTSWISIVVIIFVSICVYAIISLAAASFSGYIVTAKLGTEMDSAERMIDLYRSKDIDGERKTELLNMEERDYYILDTVSDEVIQSRGTVERFTDNDIVRADVLSADGFRLYSKAEYSFFTVDENNEFEVDPVVFFRYLLKEARTIRDARDLRAEMMSVPVWMCKPVGDNLDMFCRMQLSLSLSDFLYAAAFVTALMAIMLTAQGIVIANAIASAVRRRRSLNMIFRDMVTNGKNSLWFTFKGNRIIRKRKNRERKYAVVSLEMLNYSNFCLCHSLREGEEMLRRISLKISENVMKNELCARHSTATFALLLKYTDEERMKKRVSHIISQLEVLNPDHKFSYHAGIAIVDVSKIEDVDAGGRKLIDIDKEYNYAGAARETLSGSDESGVAFLTDALVEDRQWVDTVIERQQSALDNEEFVVYYQPKYNPKTDELSGAEALIRWESPEFGFVTPNRIIPIFEQNGFITEIDHYMITHVARDQKKWLDMGLKCVPVSVNVSRAHFIEETLAEQIRDMVDAEGCPHEYIEIELTESAFFDDKKAMLSTIGKLKSFGFAVSMDDFGSGYSSLNSLKDMPLDVLKLDAEFFRGEQQDDERGKKVVSEAIKLAKLLGMRTVAEGVEIKEQVEFLRDEECDMIQGYYYAKPEPGKAFEERMKA